MQRAISNNINETHTEASEEASEQASVQEQSSETTELEEDDLMAFSQANGNLIQFS